jgi:hypothetical protein
MLVDEELWLMHTSQFQQLGRRLDDDSRSTSLQVLTCSAEGRAMRAGTTEKAMT